MVGLGRGRVATYDDVGDPGGLPVVYLHGTPDSRLARHPDDGLVAGAGIRLLAVDRPGYGGTSPRPPAPAPGGGTAEDLAGLLDAVGVERAVLLAWSGGALDAVRAAGRPELEDRLEALWIVGGLVPSDAYADPGVRAAATRRLPLMELAATLPVDELADAVAPLVAPYPCDLATALEHQREQRDPAEQEALALVPGAVERMAEALVEAVRDGLAGARADLRAQVEPLGDSVLGQLTLPVHLRYGSADTVTPPAFGAWYAQRVPSADLAIVQGAGHYLPITHWPQLLAGLRPRQ